MVSSNKTISQDLESYSSQTENNSMENSSMISSVDEEPLPLKTGNVYVEFGRIISLFSSMLDLNNIFPIFDKYHTKTSLKISFLEP